MERDISIEVSAAGFFNAHSQFSSKCELAKYETSKHLEEFISLSGPTVACNLLSCIIYV